MNIRSNVFTLNEKKGVAYLTFDRLSAIPFIRHAFSTKLGEGTRTVHPMDMSFDHDDRDAVTENYRRALTSRLSSRPLRITIPSSACALRLRRASASTAPRIS